VAPRGPVLPAKDAVAALPDRQVVSASPGARAWHVVLGAGLHIIEIGRPVLKGAPPWDDVALLNIGVAASLNCVFLLKCVMLLLRRLSWAYDSIAVIFRLFLRGYPSMKSLNQWQTRFESLNVQF
jgi:hypothetical protein